MPSLDTGTDKLLAETRDGVAIVTFNNPARHNAVTLSMWEALGMLCDRFADAHDVRVIVLRGAGDRAFVSGADISEFDQHRAAADANEHYERVSGRARDVLAALDKPVIAMIQGHCMGGGLMIALSADLRISAEEGRFAIPAARLGVGYNYAGVRALVQVVGPSVASDILFSARHLDAAEALRVGLINRVVPKAELEATVFELAATIASNAPLSIRAAKRAILASLAPDAHDPSEIDALIQRCFESEDYAEGRRAFAEKRKPRFVGK